MHRPLITSAGALVVAAALAACTGSGSSASPSSQGSSGGAGGTSVDVTLTEFKIEISKTDLAAGPVTFNIKNGGTIAHEFVVIDTDTPSASLPVKDSEVEEDGLTVVDEKEEIEPGSTVTLTVDLAAGHYDAICNVEGHYSAGMHVDLNVQ
jgi:iron uptake system component EfeO